MDDEDFLAAVEADNAAVPAKDELDQRRADIIDKANARQEETAQPEASETPLADVALERARGPDGKFLPKDEAAEPVEAAQPEPAAEPATPEPTPEPQQAPLAALLDERDRRKAAEDRLRQIEQAQLQPQQVPDMFENPDEYNAFVAQQIDEARFVDRRFLSERLAKIEHGAETFEKAKEWGLARCDSDPFFNAKVRQSQDPYGVVMEEWRREQTASIPTDEFEQFKAWKLANGQLQQQQVAPPPGAAAPPNLTPAIPPRSLASAPSAGTMLTEPTQSDEEMFEEVIPKG